MRRVPHTIIKMALAMILTTLMALALQLTFAMTAGILAVLSIQLTKTDSFLVAFKRLLSAMAALILASGFFVLIDFSVWVFLGFSVGFIVLSFLLKLEAGIVPSLVLSSQLLQAGTWSWGILWDSLSILLLAVTVALAVNLLYPSHPSNILKKYTLTFDQYVRDALKLLSEVLLERQTTDDIKSVFTTLMDAFDARLKEAELANKDVLFDTDRFAISYLRMRHGQMLRLERMMSLALALKASHPHREAIGDYLVVLIEDIGLENKATAQKEKLTNLLDTFRQSALPATRLDFETRAILFQMMHEIDGFLSLKLRFHRRHPNPKKP